MKKILIIGATGILGAPVAKQLIADGFDVTIFSTNAKRARGIFPKATITEGNLSDPASVAKALVGQDFVYLNLTIAPGLKESDWNPERDGVKTLLAEAKKAGIKRIGYLSPKIAGYGDWWVMKHKRMAVENIKKSGIPYYIFSATSFMDNFNTTQRDGAKINVVGKSNIDMYYITAADYARQVSRAFALPGAESKTFSIQGTTAYKIDTAADIFVKNYTKEALKVAKAPAGLLKFIGLFNPTLSYVVKLMDALNNHPEPFEAKETWELLGHPTTTLTSYASQS